MNETYLGLVAGAVTCLAAVPQVVKTYRSKQARDISIWQPVILNCGMILWLYYGIRINDLPLVTANIFSIACTSSLIVMKILYRGDDNARRDGYPSDTNSYTEGL